MSDNSGEQVASTELVVAVILNKTGNTKDFLRASFVSPFWNSIAKNPAILSAVVNRNTCCFVGFLCEYVQGSGRELMLVVPPGTPADDPARSMRERFNVDALYGKLLMGTHGAYVISQMASGKQQGKIYISRPCGSKPRTFTKVARPIDPMEKIPGDNTLGQFAVLPPDNGPEGGRPVFFVKDWSSHFAKLHTGNKAMTAGRVRLHVLLYCNGHWFPRISDPLVPPSAVTFQRSPYCVQAGSRLYMMYLIDLIAWFDAEEEESFGVVPLPGTMGTEVQCCLEYTAGPHPQGDLAIVRLDNGCLIKWVLTRHGDMADWDEETRVELVSAFGELMNSDIFDALAVPPADWHGIQVRSLSTDGRYVLISIGMFNGLYIVDMVEEKARVVPNLGQMGRVFAISQTWPPKP